jgi:hypothetical protein
MGNAQRRGHASPSSRHPDAVAGGNGFTQQRFPATNARFCASIWRTAESAIYVKMAVHMGRDACPGGTRRRRWPHHVALPAEAVRGVEKSETIYAS